MTATVTSELAEPTVRETAERFEGELRSFFALCILNLVFGALILAFGVQFIVMSVLALESGGTSPWFAVTQILAWGAIAVIGLRWIISSAEVLSGVTELRDEYQALEGPVSKETLAGLILRMMVQYRKNRKAVRLMTLVCTLGGAIFLVVGAMNLVQAGIAAVSREAPYLSLLAAGITLAIGVVALRLSTWFRRYSRAWDLRIEEATRSEQALRQKMEQG